MKSQTRESSYHSLFDQLKNEDLDIFERERAKCPKRIDKILYHGTQIDSISNILTDQFIKSEVQYQHGKGVYFTESLDYCWFYGGTVDNRNNMDTVPNVDDIFTLIASFVYYDKNGFRKVLNNDYDPKKLKSILHMQEVILKQFQNQININFWEMNILLMI